MTSTDLEHQRVSRRVQRASLTLVYGDHGRVFPHGHKTHWPEHPPEWGDVVQQVINYTFEKRKPRPFRPTPSDFDDMLPALKLMDGWAQIDRDAVFLWALANYGVYEDVNPWDWPEISDRLRAEYGVKRSANAWSKRYWNTLIPSAFRAEQKNQFPVSPNSA